MKKRLAALAAAVALCLAAGCDDLGQRVDYDAMVRETLAREYSFTADVAYNGTSATVQVKKTGAGDLQLDFTAPPSMEGLSVTAAGEDLTVRFRGMEVDISAYAIPAQSALTLLREVLAGEKPAKLDIQEDDQTVTASGSILLTSYDLTFDKETMALTRILIPSVEGDAEITDFVFLDGEQAGAS